MSAMVLLPRDGSTSIQLARKRSGVFFKKVAAFHISKWSGGKGKTQRISPAQVVLRFGCQGTHFSFEGVTRGSAPSYLMIFEAANLC